MASIDPPPIHRCIRARAARWKGYYQSLDGLWMMDVSR
jgi:hypothetical protein